LFTPEVGAAAFRLRLLAEGLLAAGHRVEVVTTTPPAGTPTSDDGALRVSRWPVLRDSEGNVRGYVQYLSFDVPLVLRLLRGPRPALTISEQPPTTGLAVWLASAIRRTPYACYAADVWSDGAVAAGAPKPVLAVLRRVESLVFRHAAQILSVSQDMADRVRAHGVPDERIIVVPNGVDVDVFTPEGEAEQAPEPYAVYTGTMSEWQGADVFVKALARTSTGRLVFLGQGSDQPHLQQLAEQLCPGRVEFRGVVPAAEAARVIRGARVALVSIKPGIGYDFAIPTKIFAATGCGVPVVFAGQGAGAATVERNELGSAVRHDEQVVADVLEKAFATELDDGTRARLVAWTRENASLRANAQRAADALLQAVGLS
jgi:glycosyltransferase involved in cell wall biosynthesis